jgi:hypothetical protein
MSPFGTEYDDILYSLTHLKISYFYIIMEYAILRNKGLERNHNLYYIFARSNEAPPHEVFDKWFCTNMTFSGRCVSIDDIYKRARAIEMSRDDFFEKLEKKCGQSIRWNGGVYFIGWSLKPSSSDNYPLPPSQVTPALSLGAQVVL